MAGRCKRWREGRWLTVEVMDRGVLYCVVCRVKVELDTNSALEVIPNDPEEEDEDEDELEVRMSVWLLLFNTFSCPFFPPLLFSPPPYSPSLCQPSLSLSPM